MCCVVVCAANTLGQESARINIAGARQPERRQSGPGHVLNGNTPLEDENSPRQSHLNPANPGTRVGSDSHQDPAKIGATFAIRRNRPGPQPPERCSRETRNQRRGRRSGQIEHLQRTPGSTTRLSTSRERYRL